MKIYLRSHIENNANASQTAVATQRKEDLRVLPVGCLAMDLKDRTRTIHFKGKLTHYTITKIFQMELLLNKNRASDSSRYIREFEATRDSSSFSIFIIKEWTIDRPPFQAQEKYPRKPFGRSPLAERRTIVHEKIYASH